MLLQTSCAFEMKMGLAVILAVSSSTFSFQNCKKEIKTENVDSCSHITLHKDQTNGEFQDNNFISFFFMLF